MLEEKNVSDAITLSHIWKRFDKKIVLDDISLSIRQNEFFVLIGPSGVGKTTLLRLIAGLERPSSGEIRFGDRVMNDVEPQGRKVRMAFENYSLYPHLSVWENLASPLKVSGMNKEGIRQRVQEMADMLDIGKLLNRLPGELSNGQRQRVSLGRALVVDSEAFLLDEPLAHLDARIRHELRAKFQDIKSFIKQGSVIYVTHDYQEALALGDRIAVLDSGKIQQIGTPEEIYNNPCNLKVASLIGQPIMNIEDVDIVKNNDSVLLKNENIELNVPRSLGEKLKLRVGTRIKMGIRPQHWLTSSAEVERTNGGLDAVVSLLEVRNYKGVVRMTRGNFSTYLLKEDYGAIREGDRIRITPNWEEVHFFDDLGDRIAV